ncbi:MAG: lipid-A-disaccharide synthase [bacterium]
MGDLLLVTGDSSSDRYAANLITYLKEQGFDGTIHAAAGPESERAGANLVENLVDRAVVGLTEVVGSLPFFFSLMSRLDRMLDEKPIQGIVLMDFPGFNMRFAKRAYKKDIPLFYYITPQVWAWGQNRIEKLKTYFEKLFVIFPFEEDFLRSHGADAEFVGHPLYRELMDTTTDDLYDLLDISREKRIVSFFPGSRDHEIQRHLEPMAQTALNLVHQDSSIKPILSAAPTVNQELFLDIFTDEMKEKIPIWNGQSYPLLKNSALSILASGTITMEATFAGTPMIVGYRTSWVTYLIGKLLVSTQEFAMPNLMSENVKIPELIQSEFTADRLTEHAIDYLADDVKRRDQIEQLDTITDRFEGLEPEVEVGKRLLSYF